MVFDKKYICRYYNYNSCSCFLSFNTGQMKSWLVDVEVERIEIAPMVNHMATYAVNLFHCEINLN